MTSLNYQAYGISLCYARVFVLSAFHFPIVTAESPESKQKLKCKCHGLSCNIKCSPWFYDYPLQNLLMHFGKHNIKNLLGRNPLSRTWQTVRSIKF